MTIWKFGDNIDTDQIIPAEYLTTGDPEELAKYAFIKVLPEFPKKVKRGDIIVAGENFGCGSSREHASRALKGCGIAFVIAKSFSRIFFRNSINIGLPVVEADIRDRVDKNDVIEVNLKEGRIKNVTKGEEYRFEPLPEFMQELLEKGLVEWIKSEFFRF
ncbi:MAG: 3-isopropylmalate dehydratase small subunit [Candidatus Syntropharchaeia archaeon]